MDMLILLSLFIAILALAYFTYRNLVGLDSRLRKIENILQNAEVVTTSDPASMPSAHMHGSGHGSAHGSGQGHEYTSAFVSPEYIAGWGGQGPVLTVEKEGEESDDKVVELVDDLDEDEDDDGIEEAEEIDESKSEREDDNVLNLDVSEPEEESKKTAMESVDDILKSMEEDSRRRLAETSSITRGPKVNDMKDALKKAGVSFPTTAKKLDLQKLMEEHHIQV